MLSSVAALESLRVDVLEVGAAVYINEGARTDYPIVEQKA